ncbi:MAG: phospholipase D-like domain-containing protein [Terrimicrobiaceae bacterium]|nr:phospholipase D-like domain-containing protein [Terrimicrobiaceae bacterium]
MTEFVVTPTEKWLEAELQHCKSQLLISSPYVGGWLPLLQKKLGSGVRRLLLTRADIRDFASGASDLEAVCALASDDAEILVSHRLHAKVYVIDELCSLVTSANATFSGMRGNLECGVVIRDPSGVRAAADLICGGFGAREALQRWSASELESLREPVRELQKSLSAKQVTADLDSRLLADVNPERPVGQALLENLSGWTRLVLEAVQIQQTTVFTLDSLMETCAPAAFARYPGNQNVRSKVRQQLQRLRDLGVIQFLGKGSYRWSG